MPVSHDPNARGVGWPCREAERARAARAVAAPAADAGAPKAKTVKRDPSQPRKIGPVYVHILDQVPARRASGDDACAALAFICIPYRVSKSWRLTYLTATLTGLAALYRYPLLSPPQGECPQQTEPLLICSCQIHLKVTGIPVALQPLPWRSHGRGCLMAARCGPRRCWRPRTSRRRPQACCRQPGGLLPSLCSTPGAEQALWRFP